jgi:hypothetical protein
MYLSELDKNRQAVEAYNILGKYLKLIKSEPLQLSTIPIQWIERDGLDKEPLEQIQQKVDHYLDRVIGMLENVRKNDPYKTGLLYHDVAQNAQHLAGLLYILHDRTPLPEKSS